MNLRQPHDCSPDDFSPNRHPEVGEGGYHEDLRRYMEDCVRQVKDVSHTWTKRNALGDGRTHCVSTLSEKKADDLAELWRNQSTNEQLQHIRIDAHIEREQLCWWINNRENHPILSELAILARKQLGKLLGQKWKPVRSVEELVVRKELLNRLSDICTRALQFPDIDGNVE